MTTDWLPIKDAPKDGSVITLKYDLEGLSMNFPREVDCWWNDGIKQWVFEGRAVRGYSEGWPVVGWRLKDGIA